LNENIDILIEATKNSKNIVFFGGAGVSTESGIPDFRSKDGLYNQKGVMLDMMVAIFSNQEMQFQGAQAAEAWSGRM